MKVAFPVLLTSAIALGSRAESLLQVAGGTVRSVVYGLIGTALAQAILQGFGLWLAGVPAALFLGFVTFFLSFIPGGPPIVWLSGAGWLLYEGAFGWSLFLAIWGFVVVSSADNVLRPYLISRGSKLPLILVLLGVLGGLVAFGSRRFSWSDPAGRGLCADPGVDRRRGACGPGSSGGQPPDLIAAVRSRS